MQTSSKMWRRWIHGISSCDLTGGRGLIDANNSSHGLNYKSETWSDRTDTTPLYRNTVKINISSAKYKIAQE